MLTFHADRPIDSPPTWALLERKLLDLQNRAITPFLAKYLDDDGGVYWPYEDDYVGIDGHDDLYEGFYTWPLVYIIGGDEKLLTEAKAGWEAIVEHCSQVETPFGHPMVVDEYEQCRDWFHQGEGNLLFYNIGLADPEDKSFAARAERFAGFYLPESDTGNYDHDKRIVTAPQNGRMGPDYANPAAVTPQTTFGGYGAGYRWSGHGSPFRDVSELESVADLQDLTNEDKIYELYAQRCSKGDIPLNLNITSLMTHAFLYTGDDRYREWVIDYIDAWTERTRENNGIIPDNVGRSGEVGKYIDGRWYGGLYGWTWGGYSYMGIGPTVSGENALLLTGDDSYFDMCRSTIDTLIVNSIDRYVPHKYGPPGDYYYNPGDVLRADDGEVLWDDGWYEFKEFSAYRYPLHLWYGSRSAEDRERLGAISPDRMDRILHVSANPGGKEPSNYLPWVAYLEGEFPSYPQTILNANRKAVHEQLAEIRADDRHPSEYTEDYLRHKNPVIAEGLLQLTMGAPKQIYYGGLLQAAVRHFDAENERPGLPSDVSVLVEKSTRNETQVTYINLGSEHRSVITQGGAYGEHTFCMGRVDDGESRREINDSTIKVSLPSNTSLTIELSIDRFDNTPTYSQPY